VIHYEAPAKLNLGLLVGPPRSDGYHPIDSLVQTVDWVDDLSFEESEEEDVVFYHADLDPEDNLVAKAIRLLNERHPVPRLRVEVTKSIPIQAGLGGGSSDAAATLAAISRLVGLPSDTAHELAPELGADVRLFLTGGTLMAGGIGDQIESVRPLQDFAVAIAVPQFGLSSAEVYRRWDELSGPTAEPIESSRLPPSLRGGIPVRNDLTAAAIAEEPELGDFMADLRAAWATPVCLTGSGSGCFGLFASVDEATSAADSVAALCRDARGVALRRRGVAWIDRNDDEEY
jgi:4-diphosphocytidyl-2-C-methyl-D-erythritol kinase